ncbi:DUF5448 family protein [Salmonella enterica subsp. houtenae serovar 43:z4]
MLAPRRARQVFASTPNAIAQPPKKYGRGSQTIWPLLVAESPENRDYVNRCTGIVGAKLQVEEMNLDHFNMCVAENISTIFVIHRRQPNEQHRQTGAA